MISFIVQTRAACSFKWSNRWDHIAQASKRSCNCVEAAYEWITTLDLCAIYFLGYLFWTHTLCWTPRFRMTSSNDSGALPPTGPPGIWYSTYDHNRNQILCNIKWYSRCWCLSAFLWHCCSMYVAPWYVWRICLYFLNFFDTLQLQETILWSRQSIEPDMESLSQASLNLSNLSPSKWTRSETNGTCMFASCIKHP